MTSGQLQNRELPEDYDRTEINFIKNIFSILGLSAIASGSLLAVPSLYELETSRKITDAAPTFRANLPTIIVKIDDVSKDKKATATILLLTSGVVLYGIGKSKLRSRLTQ